MQSTLESFTSSYPTVPGPYSPDRALDDLPAIKHAAHLFLDSKMLQAEEYCLEVDPKRERLYLTSGYCLIQCLKALMSYEDRDLEEALKHINHGNVLASQHRAPPPSLTSRVVSMLVESSSSGIGFIKGLSPVQRHAELLYAETLCAKALVKIVSSGSWLTFVKEALNLRLMINIYMQLGEYLKIIDTEAATRGEGPEEPLVDKDFRSGVELGLGASNLILSFLPDKVIAVAELFGYKGDRDEGLRLLMKAGGWSREKGIPDISAEQEGLRRPLADIALIVFHLVISSFTYKGVDIRMAEKVLHWNLSRFRNGVFYLFGQGRLRMIRGQPALAIESYKRAVDVQSQYRNLHYISFWEMAICNFSLWDMEASIQCWRKLAADATWSKACYYYGTAVCLLELGGDERKEEASRLLDRIPSVLNRIAGKSIPIEKFVARKARKFQLQGGRLLLPALEYAYLFLSINHAPINILISRMMPIIDQALGSILQFENNISNYNEGRGYWDDLCLTRFLEGACARYIAFPEHQILVEDNNEILNISLESMTSRALDAFKFVVQHGSNIELDHYILYHSHYELGKLYICLGQAAQAREHLELISSGVSLEKKRKGKYGMQSALMMRASAALDELDGPKSE